MANYAPMITEENQTSSPKSSSSFLGILLSIILTAIVIGGGLVAYQYLVLRPAQDNLITQKDQQITNLNNQTSILQQQLTGLQKTIEDDAKKMLTFINNQYGYSISYPQDVMINDNSVLNDDEYIHQIKFTKTDNDTFIILRVKTEEETALYMDQELVETVILGGVTANKYVFNNGICDGPSCSAPVVAIKVYQNGKAYILEFHNVTEITGQNLDVLNSFQFNN